ncbi:serine threonine-protein kinase sck1 [Seiridium cupressi]
MHQLIRTIKYLHKLDLVHRDVKPENIFFPSGPHTRTRVFLGDLGCAKATTWDRMNSNVGTSPYKAPEAHVNRQPTGNYGKEIDTWSPGITLLYAMEDINQQLYLMFDRSSLRSTFSVQAQDFVQRLDHYFGLEESPFFPSSKAEASADTDASKKAKTAAGHSTAS